MEIKSAKFAVSNQDYKKCPAPNLPEFAFIGRSNVGKSSLINCLCKQKKLAKTSSQPGKTQLINHFNIDDIWYLVDLPGYGYARVSKKSRSAFGKMITDYIFNRTNLLCVFVLIDSRIPPQKIDIEFINELGENQIPFSIIFTKADKLTNNEVAKNTAAFKKALKQYWEELPPTFITSSETGQGREEVLNYISEIIPLFS
jgi:GTP-binding protein